MKKNILTGVLTLSLLLGGIFFTTQTAEAKNNKHNRVHTDNGLHLGWYKNGKYDTSSDTFWGSRGVGAFYFDDDFQDLLERMRALLAQFRERNYTQDRVRNNSSEVDVFTRSATDIEEDRATLRGEIDFNDSDEAEVYFEWGESRYDLDEETSPVRLDDSDDENFERTITGLDEDETYYYRAVAEDEDGEEDYGTIYQFTTDATDEEHPDVSTRSAQDITEDSADLGGTVDMNDFNNGDVFLVYGEDEDQVDDVADDFDTYNEVDEDGDDLQKMLLDSDLDSTDSYTEEITGLDTETEHFFSLCVAFEDEDNDDTIICGVTKSFTTDN